MDVSLHTNHHTFDKRDRHNWLAMKISLAAGVFMLLIKVYAYVRTGSAAILSDAAESVVHIFAVGFAAFSLRLSLKPADEDHRYGHDRVSFFSAGFEGAMIVIAALAIIAEAVRKWVYGLEIDNVSEGAAFIAFSAVANGLLGWYLVYRGKKHHSLVLEANGKHVLTDSWTSIGVIVGLVLILLTGWRPWDPLVAIIVALNILVTGGQLMRRSIGGLMDESDPATDSKLMQLLERESRKFNVDVHDLRHRNAGNKLLVEFHLAFHEDLPLSKAHEIATTIEREIHDLFSMQTEIISHLEPCEGHGDHADGKRR